MFPSHANTDSSHLTGQDSAFPRLRKQLRKAGEGVFYVETKPLIYWWLVMLKQNRAIMICDDDKNTFYNSVSETTLKDLDNECAVAPQLQQTGPEVR